eukprot:679217-Prorocentrum_minimum.AAC.2
MKHCHSYRLRVATQHAPCPPKAAKRAACWRAPQAAPPRARRSAGQAWWAGGEAPARYPPRRPRRELGRPGLGESSGARERHSRPSPAADSARHSAANARALRASGSEASPAPAPARLGAGAEALLSSSPGGSVHAAASTSGCPKSSESLTCSQLACNNKLGLAHRLGLAHADD